MKRDYILKLVKRSKFKTVKYLTFAELLKNKKCRYTDLQRIVLKVSDKDPVKDYKRGYYCTNICSWIDCELIVKKGKFYRLASLGKLYLKDPEKANYKIRINILKTSVERWRYRWYEKNNHKTTH